MDHLELDMAQPPAVGRLADLLREWIGRTAAAEDLVDIHVRPDGEEAVAMLARDGRRTEVRLHHDGEERWVIGTATRIAATDGEARAWSWLAAIVMFVLGAVVSLSWADVGPAPVVLGLASSVVLAVLVGAMTGRRHADRNAMEATHATGGQEPAERLLDELEAVLRTDHRVLLHP